MFDQILEEARVSDVTPEIALALLEMSRIPENALKLFKAASEMRDEYLGRQLWWTASIEAILPCTVEPKCGFCSFSNEHIFDKENILKSLKALESLGFKHLHLSGGTNLTGYDNEIIEIVKSMQEISDVEIEVNLGPSINRDTVRKLKELNISSITSSLECFNEEIFNKAKPGDSLAKRKELLEICEAESVAMRSMMLIGLGESNNDRVNYLFYLKGLKHLSHLRFSRFSPFPSTEYCNHPRCSPWEVARTVSVARLILPDVQLGLAAGNTPDDIPLWFLAGGGNQLLGAVTNKNNQPELQCIPARDRFSIVNRMEIQKRYVLGMGLSIGFNCPPIKRLASGRLNV